jgi:AAA15 family ATPase/GTPase
MLIECSVTNFRSIREKQTLSLVASSSKILEDHVFPSGIAGLPSLLRSAVCYGPNASGKSNFIKAVDFMREFVMESSIKGQHGDPIKVAPFAFDAETKTSPSEFEIFFIRGGIRYQYGFAVDATRVVHEWVFAYPEGRPQKWFERIFDTEKKSYEWYLGSKLIGNKKVWKDATRENALFLSTAIQLNSEQLKPVFDWFTDIVIITQDVLVHPGFTASQCEKPGFKQRIIEFMNNADFSVEDISVVKKNISYELLPDEWPTELKDKVMRDLKGSSKIDVKLLHPDRVSGDLIPIDLEDESSGTQKYFSYAGPWLDILDRGRVLFVDELESSLHPLMLRYLVGLFNKPASNRHNAQLVFSTHDTSILDKDIFRRDQVWFFGKNKDHSSRLFPLSDFKPRDNEALEKRYLEGRYGGIPFIGGYEL